MIQEKTVIAIIPARGGSKRLPGKNIKPLAGKPLIAWTIEEAQKSKYIDRLILSTDSKEIAEVAKLYGCEVPFIRPAELSDDKASSNDVVMHALDEIDNKYDIVIILQPTSPLRKVKDIDGALDFMLEKRGEVLVSVCEAEKPLHWYHIMTDNGRLKPCVLMDFISASIKSQCAFMPNGALFIADIPFFKKSGSFYTDKTLGYLMRNDDSVDIDSYMDFMVADAVLKIEAISKKSIAL